MHTLIILAASAGLLLCCSLLGHAWAGGLNGAALGAKVFIGLWLVAAAVNLWIGVSKAGYSVADETPIFLGVFGVPAAIAALLAWKLS